MTNLKQALTYGLLLVGGVFIATILLIDVLFGDLTNTDSYKPLWVIVPAFLGLAGYLIYKSKKK